MPLPIIQSLWIGNELSTTEQLCIKSFVKNGHDFHLYIYDDVKNIPAEATIKDANTIIPKDKIFTYNNGRVSGFANWFRLELLYRNGGVWVDMDVICLKPFKFNTELIFGLEEEDKICNAILGLPKGHEFCKFMIDVCQNPNKILKNDSLRIIVRKLKRRAKGLGIEHTKWGETAGPTGISRALKRFDMLKFAQPIESFFPITPEEWKSIYFDDLSIDNSLFDNSFCIHLWNELSRRDEEFDKNMTFPKESLYEAFKNKYL